MSLLEILADLDCADEESAPLPDGALAEARAAAARLFAEADADEQRGAGPAAVSMMFNEIEGWLASSAQELATVRGTVAAPTLDRNEPGLAAYGYEPDVEIDADIDVDARTAVITVVVEPIGDVRSPLTLAVRNAAGVVRRGTVNAYGVVVIGKVPISEHSPNDLSFEWAPPHRDT
ncbi:hypothetical protein ACFFX1_35795 [Dactylosporangium sucinum]|uniref:hypothetical protein n=1 Tax=Dactylosporangium sucinum TaxID=1424081 RepID=UPI00167DBCC7|nr:hypothetical protein [Dactylosporangium sucinum]